jgi:GNAT superfamily N-acetyltransferase
MLQELYYSLDEQDRYYRFFSPAQDFRHQKIQSYIDINYTTDMILVGEYSEKSNKKIVAIGGFFKTLRPYIGEIGLTVHKEWRGNRISRYLLNYLGIIGRELNYKSFSGNILVENKKMLHIISNTDYPLSYKNIEDNVVDFILDISKKKN